MILFRKFTFPENDLYKWKSLALQFANIYSFQVSCKISHMLMDISLNLMGFTDSSTSKSWPVYFHFLQRILFSIILLLKLLNTLTAASLMWKTLAITLTNLSRQDFHQITFKDHFMRILLPRRYLLFGLRYRPRFKW